MSSFKSEHNFSKRAIQSSDIRTKYPDKIPVIVEKKKGDELPDIDKKKYLIPDDLNMGQFIYYIRKRISLSPEKSLFFFVGNVIPPTASLISNVYNEHKDEDGFLYFVYCTENVYGSTSIK